MFNSIPTCSAFAHSRFRGFYRHGQVNERVWMMKNLRHSLAVVSEKQLRNGFIRRPSSSFRIGRTISWNPTTWGRKTGPEQDGVSGQQKKKLVASNGLGWIP
ncbi:hypothetical protein MTR67_024423 [Solanum verrucosum]|uniref:Uncharacterized protein n=1 Tax=Solanum verrucosum TaxID=315347 RepID=A0AAF0QYZ0_SOLVR|nr:hypothetical protein MTR67_024423 [Solanum verrucosum]